MQLISREDPKTKLNPSKNSRLDIQALRALAVVTVIGFHFWPGRFPGGFIGVDIFFVISGYLIAGHLIQDSLSPEGINLKKFWSNRSLRILPLATLVLLVSTFIQFNFLPGSTLIEGLKNIIASTFYVENWRLANNSTNYLHATDVPPITQQYWSLSIEEQLYIFIPVFFIVLTFIWKKTRQIQKSGLKSILLFAVGILLIISLALSVFLTELTPTSAYFSTFTRAWEFMAGGLIAFVPSIKNQQFFFPKATVIATNMFGLALVLYPVFYFSSDTPFPGISAIIPVLGTVLLLWSGSHKSIPTPTVQLGRVKPLSYVGDISYGLYLWHWPVLILLPVLIEAPNSGTKLFALFFVFIVSAITKVYVEDFFRFTPFWRTSYLKSFLPGFAGMALTFGVAFLLLFTTTSSILGIGNKHSDSPSNSAYIFPSAVNRSSDIQNMYDCFDFDGSGAKICEYGNQDSEISIAIAGDSHAAHWIPGLIDLVDKNQWKLTTLVGMNCDAAVSQECAGGEQFVSNLIKNDYDIVLVSSFRGSSTPINQVESYWSTLSENNVDVVSIVDVPNHSKKAFSCIDNSNNLVNKASKCNTEISQALNSPSDRVKTISEKLGISSIDLTGVFCSNIECMSIIDGITVYQDTPSSHMTGTFSKYISSFLGKEIQKFLPTSSSK